MRGRPALLLLLAITGACADRPRTQVLISLATDMNAPIPLERVRMSIERFWEDVHGFVPIDNGDLTTQWLINAPPDRYELPGSLVAFSDPKAEPKIRVTVYAENATGRFIRRQSVLRLVREKTLFMRLGLTSRCLDDADCPEERTCIEGRCRDPEIDARSLPDYQPGKRPEFGIECDSGTAFINTTTKTPLTPALSAGCPSPGQVCLEGTCYRKEVFGQSLPLAQKLEVLAQVTDETGAPLADAELKAEDGPVALVRTLRSEASAAAPATAGPATPVPGMPGLYRLEAPADALTTELRLTVSSPGHAPQVVTVPYKAGVARYLVPVVLAAVSLDSIPPGQPRSLALRGAGRAATLELPATADTLQVRYALLDGRFAPGLTTSADASGLLQSGAVLYLENVSRGSFPAGTRVTLDTASTPPVVGVEGEGSAYVLDLQGAWRKRADAQRADDPRAGVLRPASGGFWTLANQTSRPGCVRGKILKPDRSPCPGARVRLWGPAGVNSFDSAGADGGFCAAAAQQEAAVLAVGNSSRALYVPAVRGAAARCALSDSCADAGEILVDSAADCELPPRDLAGRTKAGDACTRSGDCAPLASCYRGFCVGEGYVRVSVVWAVSSDFDLHVKLPDGRVLYEKTPEIERVGRLDVQQCTPSCTGNQHLENVVLATGAPAGSYEAWVENYDARAAGDAEIEVLVAGQRREQRTVAVPATASGRSPSVTFTLP
jgi:hypothetical protein